VEHITGVRVPCSPSGWHLSQSRPRCAQLCALCFEMSSNPMEVFETTLCKLNRAVC
jgi:hypothetical protein